MDFPHIILEVASIHGGDETALHELIAAFRSLRYPSLGMKFQVFKYDTMALPDYSHFEVYKRLFIAEEAWDRVISSAHDTFGSVWIDVFDAYGVAAIARNVGKLRGVKLQASVLDNHEIIDGLSLLSMGDLELVVNVSGYDIHEIEGILARYAALGPKQLILQVGFQGYPTRLEDTALNKISILREAFPNYPLCFADHLAGEEKSARRIPVLAIAAGCKYIEKHVCISRENTEFDALSSLEPGEFEEMLTEISQCIKSLSAQFISHAERKYLSGTLQAPVLSHGLQGGQLVAPGDVIYRRTEQAGLTWRDIDQLQRKRHLLSHNVSPYSTLREGEFRPARIAVIVACRMKSSRLKNKAILPIQGMASVERCLSNCLRFPHAHEVILATSNLEEDRQLEDYTLGGRVKFWRGDPEDVIQRYLGACEAYDIDVIIRVTADCPAVSPEMAGSLLESHFAAGADYTAPIAYAVGSNSEIYNVEALKRVIHHVKRADYSEYMTWYMQNNADIFKVNLVNLSPDLVRDYRLTLDYQEDLEMLEQLYAELENRQLEPTLTNVFKILDMHPEIVGLNKDMEVCYQTNQELINTLNRVTRIEISKDNAPGIF